MGGLHSNLIFPVVLLWMSQHTVTQPQHILVRSISLVPQIFKSQHWAFSCLLLKGCFKNSKYLSVKNNNNHYWRAACVTDVFVICPLQRGTFREHLDPPVGKAVARKNSKWHAKILPPPASELNTTFAPLGCGLDPMTHFQRIEYRII